MKPRWEAVVLCGLTTLLMISRAGAANSIQTPDTAFGNNVGLYSSLALDANGYPVVSHLDETNNNLKVLHCNDPNCEGGDESIEVPDGAGGVDVGWYTSLALDANGYPVVSYRDPVLFSLDGYLKILHCNDPNCAGGDESVEVVDSVSGVDVGWYTSLVLDASGYPVVSYWDITNRNLKILHCNDPNCTGGDESIVVADGAGGVNVGNYTSLALDANGYPVVSYFGETGSALKILHCNDANCAGGDESIEVADGVGVAVGRYTSLVLDADGHPVVSYRGSTNDDLRILHCNDPNCAGGDESIEVVDGAGGVDVGWYTSLALDANGHPVVSYLDHDNQNLKILRCNDPNCAGGDESTEIADSVGELGSGRFTSLALNADGHPVVSYHDNTLQTLKILHCGDADCEGNTAPVPDAGGPYSGLPNIGIALDGSGTSDPENDIITFDWSVDNPASCGFDNNTLESPVLTCNAAGTYLVTLTTDDGDLTADDDAQVAVLTSAQAIKKLKKAVHDLTNEQVLSIFQALWLGRPLSTALHLHVLENAQHLRLFWRYLDAIPCWQLQKFIDRVVILTPTPLDPNIAADLVDDAELIREVLECP